MRFNCGPTLYQRLDTYCSNRMRRRAQWHRKFAWLPTRIDGNDCVWLEFYERRITTKWAYEWSWTEVNRRVIDVIG